jgi:hypothetical protein
LVYCEVEVYVGAEPEPVVFTLGSCIDPAALIATERALAVVVGDDVLAQLRTDQLKQESEMPEHWPCAEDRVTLLRQIPNNDPHKEPRKKDDDPEGCTHAKPRYQWQLQWSKDLELLADATCVS